MKNKISSILLLFVMLTALLPSFEAFAQGEQVVVEIQPDGASLKDVFISSGAQNTNFAGGSYGNYLYVGEQVGYTSNHRSLLEFDLTGLPRDAVVSSAVLELTVAVDGSNNARNMNLYIINSTWNEGQATWGQRAVSTPWQVAGASGEQDMIQTSIGTVAVADNLAVGTKVSITITDMEAVEAMIKENYFGFLLSMETEIDDLYQFYSSDYATAADRPKLTITYTPSGEEVLDPGWTCVNVSPYLGCSEEALAAPPMSPFTGAGNETGGYQTVGYSGAWYVRPQMAAKLNCEPYPRCINDYPIYYRFTYDVVWNSAGSTSGTFNMLLETNGTDVGFSVPCGTGITGKCKGVVEGEISMMDLPENLDAGFTIGLETGLGFPSNYVVPGHANSWTLYLSLIPFDQNCAETWYVPVPDTYVIDPTLEAPLGMEGAPADNQIYPTVIDQVYMVRVEDGPWNDGTNDSTAAAVSYDGVEWMSWEEFSVDAICVDVSSADPDNADYRILYFTAPSETFYIRVDDTAAAFANNTNNETTPFQYVIGIAFALAGPVECDSQFTFDPVYDNVASVTVPSTSEDVAANNELTEPLEAGAWYGIEVASGSWNENSPTTLRYDLEFAFAGSVGSSLNWSDLAEGSALVECVSADGKTVYIQAPSGTDLVLHLRVNDQDAPQNWADNTGTLGVNIYKTTFTRQIDGCELQFDIGTFVSHGDVAANASNGLQFATVLSLGGTSDIFPVGEEVTYSYGLTPGGWYMLETTDGPWYQTFTGGGYESSTHYYDVKLKSDNGEWTTPETWALAECTVTIDSLGHQRIYFQAPENGIYHIKVGGAGPFGRGSMGWDLYQAMDLGIGEATDCQDYIYDPEVASGFGTVDSELANGAPMIGLGTNNFYAIQIESDNEASDPPYYEKSGWYESDGADEQDDLEITIDGTNWQDLPNHPAVLCYYYTPESNELVFFIRVIEGQTWKMRANSTTFNNNVGVEYYRIYQATAGDNVDPWTGCSDDYQATVPAINEHEWIPPQDEEGVMLMPTLTYTPEADPDGDGVIIWGNPGLEAGHFYMVEIKDGPWYDQLPKQSGSYLAQLSSDGGVTWNLFEGHPDVICYVHDQTNRYWKAIFEVTTDQVWKIRVADTETEVFTDNSGNLAYRLTLVNEFPVDGPGSVVTDYDPGAFDVCLQSLVRPQSLTLSEIGSLGNYFGDWIQYINRSMLSYFAWCPRHTDMLISAMEALKTKEPLATIADLATVQKNITAEVDSYDWDGGGYEDTSIFNANSNAKVEAIFDNIIPQSGEGVSPWDEGGDLVDFSAGGELPSYYYTCDNVFADYLPSRLRVGVCFTSAYWKQTGASFWVQLSLDISAIFALIIMLKGAVQSLVYMMTGVRPWTKDGASKMIIEVANGSELIQPVEKWRTRR